MSGTMKDHVLVSNVLKIYDQLSSLKKPCSLDEVNKLFTQLSKICNERNAIDVTCLPMNVQTKMLDLMKMCADAERHTEWHCSAKLGTYASPLDHLKIFPHYYENFKLCEQEFDIYNWKKYFRHGFAPRSIAFVGSGPLPLSPIFLANFFPNTYFYNYDIDASANSLASKLVSSDPNLSHRMVFHTTDILNVTNDLKDYDVIFLAAFLGTHTVAKRQVIKHLGKYMKLGAFLMLRTAQGARAFLRRVIPKSDLSYAGFDVLRTFQVTDLNGSTILALKQRKPIVFE